MICNMIQNTKIKLPIFVKKQEKRVNNAFLNPRNGEDLKARRELFEVWAKATFGLMGRTPDFLGTVVNSNGIE